MIVLLVMLAFLAGFATGIAAITVWLLAQMFGELGAPGP